MKCSKCEKDFEAGVKSAYQLGLQDGENRLKRTVNKVLKNNNNLLNTNRYLTQELLNLNNLSPLEGTPSIIIPLKKAKQISKRLYKSPLKEYFIKLIDEQLQIYPDLPI